MSHFVPCTRARFYDGSGPPEEWERDLANSRRPPWIQRRARFIQRRLIQPDYRVHVWLRHLPELDLVIVEVPCHAAGISRRKALSLFPYLSKWDWTMVNVWGESLLTSHLDDFMAGIAEVPPQEWDRAVETSPYHQHYGLMLRHDPARLAFGIYPQRVADAIKQSLTRAAMEAAQ